MARRTFPDDRLAFTTAASAGAVMRNSIGSTATFYTDAACTALADIRFRNANGTDGGAYVGSVLTVAGDGLWPLYLGPDDSSDTLYYKPAGSDIVYQHNARLDDRLDVDELGIYKVLAADPNLLVSGTITYDGGGAATSAPVTWPDGSTGTYTATTVSPTFPGLVDAYTVTKSTTTYTQPAVTRSGTGAVTSRPAIVVS